MVDGACTHQASFGPAQPAKVIALVPLLPGRERQPPDLALLLLRLSGLRHVQVDLGDAVGQRSGIDVDEPRNALGRLIHDSGDDVACVAMPHQHYVAQLLVPEQVHDVGDVGIEIHLRPSSSERRPQRAANMTIPSTTSGRATTGSSLGTQAPQVVQAPQAGQP
jgi:hypothetical protein